MTNEQVERAIEFLLKHHSKVSADIERNSEQIAKLTADTAQMKIEMRAGFEATRAGFEATRAGFEATRAGFEEMRAGFEEMRVGFGETHAGFGEVRKAIDDLIVANEVTRKLAEDVARLAIATSHRVTDLESKL